MVVYIDGTNGITTDHYLVTGDIPEDAQSNTGSGWQLSGNNVNVPLLNLFPTVDISSSIAKF